MADYTKKAEMEKELDKAADKEEAAIKKEEAAAAHVASVKAASVVPDEDKAYADRAEKLKAAKEERKAELYKMIGECLRDHENAESNIGLQHEYWQWTNELRSLK